MLPSAKTRRALGVSMWGAPCTPPAQSPDANNARRMLATCSSCVAGAGVEVAVARRKENRQLVHERARPPRGGADDRTFHLCLCVTRSPTPTGRKRGERHLPTLLEFV